MTNTQRRHLQNYMGKNPRKAKKTREHNCCPNCGAHIQMVPASAMNFHTHYEAPDGKEVFYWRCSCYPACDTYIKADPRTGRPSGILANAQLRYKRVCIHKWEKLFEETGYMPSPAFRQMCASRIGLFSANVVHTREMTEYKCDAILDYLKKLYENDKKVHAVVESAPNSAPWQFVRGITRKPDPQASVSECSDGT